MTYQKIDGKICQVIDASNKKSKLQVMKADFEAALLVPDSVKMKIRAFRTNADLQAQIDFIDAEIAEIEKADIIK